MKSFITLGLSILLLFTLCACGGGGTPIIADPSEKEDSTSPVAGSSEKEGGILIGMTTMVECSFFDAFEQGVRSAMRDGDRLIYVEGKLDADFQQGVIEDFIAQGVDIVLYNPSDTAASLPSLQMMKAAGIPIINFDSPAADMSYVDTYCATDNYGAGALAALFMIDEHPEGGTVAVIEFSAADATTMRANGFVDTVEATPGWEVVTRLDGGNTTSTALPVAEDIIAAHPNLTAIFGTNDETGLGAYSAISAAGLNIHIYSVNGGPEAKQAMLSDGEAGIWRATSAQSPILMGVKTMELAYKFLAGEKVEDEYLIEPFIICPANIDQYGHNDWQ